MEEFDLTNMPCYNERQGDIKEVVNGCLGRCLAFVFAIIICAILNNMK